MTYDQLKKKIQEAVPSIMALEFGCEVIIGEARKPCRVVGDIKIEAGNIFVPVFLSEGEIFWPEVRTLTILGRPIRLADVLVTMGGNGNWFIDDNGIFIKAKRKEFTYNYTHPNIRWNLLDDNLDNQSDECKQFLISLLV